jgi:AcrR family transcriptional regulator
LRCVGRRTGRVCRLFIGLKIYAGAVTTEFNGSGDPLRTLELLWGRDRRARRGPRPKLTVAGITAAAIELADAEGLTAVSMRRVADRLGVSGMSLYTYLPGKAELLDLMVDAVHGEAARLSPDGHWRSRIEFVARQSWDMYLRHPWLLQVATSRPALGPHTLTKYEYDLQALAGTGLSHVEIDLFMNALVSYVHGAVRSAIEVSEAETRTGMTDREWWKAYQPVMQEVFDPERFPTLTLIGQAATDEYGTTSDPLRSFDFGLRLMLDGLAATIDARRAA